MSVAKYPVMKDSELDWVGQIPEQWDLKPFFSLFKEQKRSNKGMKSDNLLSLSYGIIKRKEITTLDGLLPASFETYQIVEPDEVVFRLTDLQNDKRSLRSALVTEIGIITSAYLAVRPKNVDSRYASYLFRSYDLSKVFYSMGGGLRQGLNFADLRRLPILYPAISEQQKIAQFLDYETEKIDALIDEQKRLIELLKEKRQAVISHAVTKGLNPDAPMKDSGVEWLGEVPEHWMVTRLKFVSKIVDCKNRTPDYVENGEYLVVRTSNVKHGQLTTENAEYTDRTNFLEWTKRGVPPVNSILFTREAPAGEVCLVPADTSLCMGQRMMNIIPKSKSHTRFIFDFLTSDCLTKYINSVSHGSTVSHLRVEQVYDIPLLIPPAKEQILIDQRVSKLKRSFSALIQTALLATDKLKERRSALISSAVTGKIDVRDWQPPAGSDTVDSNASVQTERHYG